uniref:Uncharacterized protein n=1 Tax=Sphaerodactylus townsendi TaxID=933632 RepID=A0ACB8EY46_9SAUR
MDDTDSSSSYSTTISSDFETMSLSCFYNPLYGSSLPADGHGEVWEDWNSSSKFFQYGWRCTTNEDSFSNKTLLGNWNQERYDIRRVLQPKPLPSQFSHYFESTYSSDYSKEVPRSTRRVIREPHWFPGHQPELEPPPIKPTARSCYMIDYEPPHGRRPILVAEEQPKEPEETQPKQ